MKQSLRISPIFLANSAPLLDGRLHVKSRLRATSRRIQMICVRHFLKAGLNPRDMKQMFALLFLDGAFAGAALACIHLFTHFAATAILLISFFTVLGAATFWVYRLKQTEFALSKERAMISRLRRRLASLEAQRIVAQTPQLSSAAQSLPNTAESETTTSETITSDFTFSAQELCRSLERDIATIRAIMESIISNDRQGLDQGLIVTEQAQTFSRRPEKR